MSATRKAKIMQKVQASRSPIRKGTAPAGCSEEHLLSMAYRARTTFVPTCPVEPALGRRTAKGGLPSHEPHLRGRVARSLGGSPITTISPFPSQPCSGSSRARDWSGAWMFPVPAPADNEYRHKATAPHQLWGTNASYFRVAGWGYYYMLAVLDDFSRFILGWRLQVDMTTSSLIEVVQDAIDVPGMTDVPVENRTKLLSDNGSGYVSRLFREYLQLVGIRHVLAAPYHPQTNGKLERYHQTLKRDVNQLPYDVPRELEIAIGKFVDFYNYLRYHKALKDITTADMLAGRMDEILVRRREIKDRTIYRRKLSK